MDTQISITLRIPRFLTSLWTSRRRLGRALVRQLVPNLGSVALVLALLWATNAQAAPWNATARAPTWPSMTTVNYQGRLADSGGNPLNGNYGMSFAFYDSDSGGALLWGPENHPAVPVSEGLFSVQLGSQTSGGVPTGVLAGDIWLEIIVAGETLSPRERLGAVPYAMQALTVPDGAIGSRHFAPSWYEASNPSVVSTTSTDAVSTGVSVSFTCDNDCTALILHRAMVQHSVEDGRTDVIVYVDDAVAFGELGVVNVKHASSDDRFPSRHHAVNGFDFVNLSAGTHTVEVKFRCLIAGTTCYYYGDSGGTWEHLNVLVFAQP